MRRLPRLFLSPDSERPAVPLVALAALCGFAYAVAAAGFTARLVPQVQVVWWLHPVLAAAAVSGAAHPSLRQGAPVGVGRFVLAGVWTALAVAAGSVSVLLRGGWSVDALVRQAVFPGALILAGFVVATILGDGLAFLRTDVPPESTAEYAQAARDARRAVQGLLRASFKAWLLLGLFAFALAEGLARGAGAGPAAAAAAVGLAANVALLSFANLRAMRYGWRAAGGYEERVHLLPWKALLAAAGATAALAAAAPSDVSPISRQGLRTFIVNFTDFVGPLFVPARRQAASGGSPGAWERLVRLFWPGAGDGDVTSVALPLIIQIALGAAFFAATGYALWRFLRLARLRRGEVPERGPGYGGRGLLAELLGWLRDVLRAFFNRLARWARLAASGETEQAQRRGSRARRAAAVREPGGHPARRIRRLFALILRELGRKGYPREAGETAYEYAARIRRLHPDVEQEMDVVAGIYVQARYSTEERLPVLEQAYQTLRAAAARLRRAIRRKSAGPRSAG